MTILSRQIERQLDRLVIFRALVKMPDGQRIRIRLIEVST